MNIKTTFQTLKSHVMKWARLKHVEPVLHNRWLFVSVATLHTVWAALAILSLSAFSATPTNALSEVPAELDVAGLIGASLLAFLALSRKLANLATFLLLAPQNFLVMVSLATSSTAVAVSHYADGVARPWQLIAADQAWVIIFASIYVWSYWLSHLPAITAAWQAGAWAASQPTEPKDDGVN